MPPVAYTVTAELPDPDTLREYVSWLTGGHLDQIVAGGASRAEVIGPLRGASGGYEGPLRVESRYIFPTLEAFRAYEAVHAPRLRAEGLARFGPERGVRMARSLGEVAGRAGGPEAGA